MRGTQSLAALAAALLASRASASSLTPPILPLFVRTPYLSTWLANAREEPWTRWPIFWTGSEIGFSVMASDPNSKAVYPLVGRPQDSLDTSDRNKEYEVKYPQYVGNNYDASTTNLTYRIPSPEGSKAEPLELVLSFLSPVTPTSTLRQSIPAAYLSVHVSGSFDIDVYIDVNGQWVSGDRGSKIVWDLREEGSKDAPLPLKTWFIKREQELLYTEKWDHAEWGHLLFTAPTDVRHESGTSAILRQRFGRTGTLQNQVDNSFRGIMEEEPVFAFSKSFKLSSKENKSMASAKTDSVLFTIAHIQDPVVHFASSRGLTDMRPLWKSWFLTDEKVIDYHYLDFDNAKALAQNYSSQLAIDAFRSGAEDYVDIVALSARQVLGATSFSGTPDNPILFLKEISSNGNCQTVDVIFPAFPFFLYTQPRWLSYLLEPLLEHQLSGQYPNDYSMHDLGAHFPNQTGHADGRDEYMPVEECGDMLIMALALANSLAYRSSDDAQSVWSSVGSSSIDSMSESVFALTNLGTHEGIDNIDDAWGGGVKGASQARKWVTKSYKLWKQWSKYLVDFSLEPHNQLSTDDFAGWLALQVNLALKGIVGIKAMSELAAIVGNDADAKEYRNISDTYAKKWEEFATSRDKTHVKLAYDWWGSWTTLYSLYADAVLCFHPSITNKSSVAGTIGSSEGLTAAGMFEKAWHGIRGGSQKLLNPIKQSGGRDDPQKPINPPTERNPIKEDFLPSHIYTRQSKWYSYVMQKYGLPLDSRHLYTKSDWEFEAAAVASKQVRADILQRVAKWLNETVTDRPFTDLYQTEGRGEFPGPNFFARPVVGGHFAFLTLERACGGTGRDVIDAMFENDA